MRVKSFLAAVAGLMLGAQAAQADWVFQDVVIPDAALPGFDVHQYFAKLIPAGAESAATGLQSVDAELSVNPAGQASFKFKFIDTNTDGIPDAAVIGNGITDTTARNASIANLGTFIRGGDPTGGPFFAATVLPAGYQSVDTDGDGTPDPGFDPSVNYANVKDFRVAGVVQGGKDPKAVSDAKGSLFAMAVVPTGTAVTISGFVAPDAGPIVPIVVPEPASLGMIGIAGLLLARRRRMA